MFSRFSSRRGFSLVEVSIAIGIASFGLVSLLGLMGAFLSAGRESGDDNVLADLAAFVAADLRSRPFDPLTGPQAGRSLETMSEQSEDAIFHFDVEGRRVAESDPGVHYAAAIRLNAQADFNTVTTTAVNLYEARITFTWPHPLDVNRKNFYINIARNGD